MDSVSKALITQILSLPTTSFHEGAVAAFVRWYAAGLGLDVCEDGAGNLLVSFRSGRGKKPIVTFSAHMDHPGFEVISARKKRARIVLLGKFNHRTLAGARVVVQSADGRVRGRAGNRPLGRRHLGRDCFALRTESGVARGDFGHYDLPSVKFRGDRISTLAADDLMGVAAILDFMTRIKKKGLRTHTLGLFTRAEESGFLGAMAAMETKIAPMDVPLIVVECSDARAGNVAIGAGPVVRTGDKRGSYHPAIDSWLSGVASRLKEKEKERRFRYQRSLLAGGSTEAYPFVSEGYLAGGLALPLGNYHNNGPRGPAAEYVSASDYENLIRLLIAIARNPMPKDVLKLRAAPIWRKYRRFRSRLIK